MFNIKPSFKYLKEFHNISLRILVIDDKIFCKSSHNPSDVVINPCENTECINEKKEKCKLLILKELMSGKDNPKREGSSYYHYWKESGIATYHCPTNYPDDFIDNNDTCPPDKIDFDFKPKIDKKDLHVQIIGVRDVRTALLLMKQYKFDMIFSDYLLDETEKNSKVREYANQLFYFLAHDYNADIKEKNRLENKDNKTDEENERLSFLSQHESKFKALERLRHDVLDNRGPLDKLWIMPITGFNQTFIQDLYHNQIGLIDYKWNISNGADPITTPWQFLYHLNKFIELQLKSCVYRMEHLLRFVKYTCEDLQDLKSKKETFGFFDFQSFMGSEYANFMRRYGNRHLIKRDAVCDSKDNMENKSVFATYVWNAFYADKNRGYRDVIELNRLIQRFLHQASTMQNDLSGKQRLEETFGDLSFFIDNNFKVRDTVENTEDLKDNKLDNKLDELRSLMDELIGNQRSVTRSTRNREHDN